MRVVERACRVEDGRPALDERLGLPPAAVGGKRRALDLVPQRHRLRPRVRPRLAARAFVLRLGLRGPAGRVRGDAHSPGGITPNRRPELAGLGELVAYGILVMACAR